MEQFSQEEKNIITGALNFYIAEVEKMIEIAIVGNDTEIEKALRVVLGRVYEVKQKLRNLWNQS